MPAFVTAKQSIFTILKKVSFEAPKTDQKRLASDCDSTGGATYRKSMLN